VDDLLADLLGKLGQGNVLRANVIPWSSPVPAFGQLSGSRVGTLGLNPSNREFVDQSGRELSGHERRFETLTSLGLKRWTNANGRHIRKISTSCERYFANNPYDTWFKKLDLLISSTRTSYYLGTASHLDLIPFATASKWGELSKSQRVALLDASADCVARSLSYSGVRLLVLNGASVVSLFQSLFGITFRSKQMPNWTLLANTKRPVEGFSYSGTMRSLAGVAFHEAIKVIGFNHNIQSSYGVTREVITAIRDWIGQESKGVLAAA
jgi:hypothetical protein